MVNRYCVCGSELEPRKKLCDKCRDQARKDSFKVSGKKWRDSHKDRISVLNKKWRSDNLERKKATDRAWKITHRDQEQIRHKKWRAANPERAALSSKNSAVKFRDRHSATTKKWRESHPEKRRSSQAARQARKLELPATFTVEDWDRCLEYWGHCCAICGRPKGLWHTLAQDHWIPLTKGGGYTPSNIIPLCHGESGCNNSKHDQDADTWLKKRFGSKKAYLLSKSVSIYFELLG